MIAYLAGKIVADDLESIILLVGGVGYRVFVVRQPQSPEQASFYISEIIREDKHDLYGFVTRDEQTFFEKLISVQGVGPKLAQKILSAAGLDAIRGHVETGDIGFFTAISGVGKKTAQKLILELKGALVESESPESAIHADTSEALESLGYSKQDIMAVLPHITGETPESRMKSALKMLGRR